MNNLLYKKNYNQSEIDKSWLCDECKEVGYCMLSPKHLKSKTQHEFSDLPVVSDELFNKNQLEKYFKFLMNSVPLRVNQNKYNDFSPKNLDKGFEAFHQENYETALFHFSTPFDGPREIKEVLLGTALCHFMLGDYENASSVSTLYTSKFSPYEYDLEKLIDLCVIKQEDLRKKENPINEAREGDEEIKECVLVADFKSMESDTF